MKKFYLSVFAFFMLCCKVGAQQVIFDDNYASGVTFVGFGGSNNTITVDNTVFKAGSASLKVVIPSGGYTGGALVPAAPIDVSAYNAVTFWAKSSVALSFDKVGFGNNTSDANYAVEYANIPITTSWQKFIIPIPDASKLTALSGLWHMAIGTSAGASVWFDQIQYENVTGGVIGTPTASMATETVKKAVGATFTPNGIAITFPVNGSPEVLSALAPAYFTYSATPAGIVSFDGIGVGTTLAPGTATITAKLGAVNVSGVLTVTVLSQSAPTTLAPNPTVPAANVYSLFNSSQTYTDNVVDTWRTGWCNATLTDPFKVGTVGIKEYSGLVFSGTEFVAKEVNATTRKYFHVDVWTPDMTSFSVKLVDFGPTGVYATGPVVEGLKTFTLTQGTWNSLEINLDDLAALTTKGHIAQLLFVDNDNGGAGGGTVFFDNVYFSSQTTLPVRFIDFNGHLENNQAVLNWSTTNEINNKGFNVERSQDGVKFDAVSFVAGKGRGAQVNNYTYSDAKLLSGANYYRLKQTDLDGNFAYSSAIKIDYSKFAWSVQGNGTANSWIQLQLDRKATVSFKVYSLQGQLIKVINKGTTQAGTYTVPLSLGGSSHGVYIVKLQVDDKQYSNKVLN